VISFDELWTDSSIFTIGGTEVRVASIAHLIRMKEAAGKARAEGQ
jgi:hypothetical protein